MKRLFLSTFIACLTVPAVAQTAKPEIVNGKPLSFQCVYDSNIKEVAILVTNPQRGRQEVHDLEMHLHGRRQELIQNGVQWIGRLQEGGKVEGVPRGTPQRPGAVLQPQSGRNVHLILRTPSPETREHRGGGR